jgi:hypothetical protein
MYTAKLMTDGLATAAAAAAADAVAAGSTNVTSSPRYQIRVAVQFNQLGQVYHCHVSGNPDTLVPIFKPQQHNGFRRSAFRIFWKTLNVRLAFNQHNIQTYYCVCFKNSVSALQ